MSEQATAISRNIVIPQDEIAEFCKRHHIRKLLLFGSVLRDDFGPDSDIDVLVEFVPGHVPGFFGFVEAQIELSEMLEREVDLHTAGSLSPSFRQKVIDTAESVI
jgi:predicted nucleotidyltransferase